MVTIILIANILLLIQPVPGPKIVTRKPQPGGPSPVQTGARPPVQRRPIVRKPPPGGPQNPMDELAMKLAQRKQSGL